jgi:hypothetical protein
LPAGQGEPLRAASAVSIELLTALPVQSSPGGSASAASGSLSLDPALNGGMAWAIYELYDFPEDGSVTPELVSASTDADCYLSVSNFTDECWNHTLFSGAPLTLGSASDYYNDSGSMYVALIATGGAVQADSLSVQVSGPLENDGYNEHEDNDKADDANLLPAFPFTGYLGSLGSGGYDGDTSDYFSFSAAEGDLLSLDVFYEAASCNIEVTLYKPGGSSTLLEDSAGNPGARHIAIGLKAGFYTMRLRASSGGGDYSIGASLSPSGYSELEDNDVTGQANVLAGTLTAAGAAGPGSYDGDDRDFFSFEAAEGEIATLSLSYLSAYGNLSLALLDAEGQELHDDTAGNGGLRSFSWGLHAGTTYVLVEAVSGAASYALDIETVQPGWDELEDNDGFASAQPLPDVPVAGFSGSAGSFGYDGDEQDYYAFDCAAGDIVSADLAYDNSTANLSLTLYNADNSQAQKDSAGNPGTRALSWGLRGGTCYLLVKAESGSSAYTLGLSIASPGYDEVENNDSSTDANLLDAFPVAGFLGSLGPGFYDGDTTDYFTFTASDKELYDFALSYDESVSNFSLILLNGQNQTVYNDSAGNSGLRSFSWGLKAGSYYLRILAASGAGNYSLDVSRTPQSLDETEDNDTRPGAQLISLPVSALAGHCGQFGYDGDTEDYFFFNTGLAATIDSTLTYNAADGILKLYLVDGTGTILASDTAGNPGLRTISLAVGAGTYYLRVQCSSGGSDYSLDASETP